MGRTARALAAFAVSAAFALSGCDGDAAGTGGAPSGAPSSAAAAAAPGGAGAPAGRKTGLIMPMPYKIGEVVTDDYMFTLYWYAKDSTSPPRSSCVDACTVRWPPVLVDGDVRYEGGDQSLVGALVRDDGTRQLTLAGRPLYRFSGDRAEGETKGNGVDGVWFAAAPDGGKVKPAD